MFALLASLLRLEKNRDWFRERKLLTETTTLLIGEPETDVMEHAFRALVEALKMPRNVEFLKDNSLLQQLLEVWKARRYRAHSHLRVMGCPSVRPSIHPSIRR